MRHEGRAIEWIAIEMTVDAASVEVLCDALLECGATAVDVTDRHAGSAQEQARYGEPGEDGLFAWGENRLQALFPADADVAAALEAAWRLAGIAALPAWQARPVAECDWVKLTQDQFQPIRITNRLWIVPTWHAPPDPLAINISLDPGVAFGTGSHPTTRLCLQWLAGNLRPGDTVIDYGCGSGILAITAMRLGASRAVGVDIDPQSLEASRYNARLNGVSLALQSADDDPPEPADVVIANILSSPLQALAPLLASLTRPGGRVVLSGVLMAQADSVAGAYLSWFDMSPAVLDDGWARLEGRRR